ncbi:MAG: CinA family protein [Pseudomonadota bacterium]|nr:CinA family protein [Pseudomonadota bacterium]
MIGTRVQQLAALLTARKWSVATAESCTGGMIAAALTAVAGSSTWFDCGFVTYSNAAKVAMLGVSPATLDRDGAVSQATAEEMSLGALRGGRAEVAVSVTGIAGPGGGSPDKPVGRVCIAWRRQDGQGSVRTFDFNGDRAAVRRASVLAALEGLIALVEQ